MLFSSVSSVISHVLHLLFTFFFVLSFYCLFFFFFFFSSRRRHTRLVSDWSSDVCSSDLRLAEPFDALWKGERAHRIPSLLLNGTWVETGKRMIASNLAVDAGVFNDTADVSAFIDYPVPASTAAHLSARFTYVSPAGSLRKRSEREIAAHVVDGAYFENSGTATALDVLSALYSRGERLRLDFIVVYVNNAPGQEEPSTGESQRPAPARWRTDPTAPVGALFNARVA